VQPNFHDIDEYCGSRQAGISAHSEQVDDYANFTWEFARRHPRLREVRVCEVGLWCGHSAMTFLEQDPRVTLTSFSLNDTRQARDARTYLSSRYGNRVTFVLGDSATSLPSYMDSREGKGLRCDIAVVDGRHRYAAVLRDALHLHKVARCGGLMIMDDVCNPTSCHAHFPDGTNHPYVIGPSQAWAELQRLSLVRQLALVTKADRGWAYGEVLCRERPRVRPPPIRFEPDVPSAQQRELEREDAWVAAEEAPALGRIHSQRNTRV